MQRVNFVKRPSFAPRSGPGPKAVSSIVGAALSVTGASIMSQAPKTFAEKSSSIGPRARIASR